MNDNGTNAAEHVMSRGSWCVQGHTECMLSAKYPRYAHSVKKRYKRLIFVPPAQVGHAVICQVNE
jgi:hypothetical protein